MAVLSKPLWISATCYELGHCWTPYCSKATPDVAKNVFIEALKIYGTLYMMAGLLQKKGFKYYLHRYIPETLRSTIFLTINGTLFITMFCIWRKMFGFYHYYNVFTAGIPVCMLSILIENKARRGPLAVYLTNLAVETGYRMLVERKLLTPVHNGEVLLFSAVSSIYLYLFRTQNGLSQSSESLFRFFVGGSENPERDSSKDPPPRRKLEESVQKGIQHKKQSPVLIGSTSSHSPATSTTSSINVKSPQNTPAHIATTTPVGSLNAQENPESQPGVSSSSYVSSSSKPLPSTTSHTPEPHLAHSRSSSRKTTKVSSSPAFLVGLVQRLVHFCPSLEEPIRCLLEFCSAVLALLEGLPKHKCCPHNHSCLSYILKGGARMFSLGYMAQAGLSTVSALSTLIKRPSAIKGTLFSRVNLKMAAFLGSYSAIFRASNCILRWVRGKDSPTHGLIGGALAGLSLRFYRSVTVALYAATKLVEILYFKGIDQYKLPHIKSADVFIYAFSTAFIFHAAVMEPHTLRPGYWKFLLRVTGNKFAMMNRRLLDVFGVNSSKIAPDYWPNYDPTFTDLAFKKPS